MKHVVLDELCGALFPNREMARIVKLITESEWPIDSFRHWHICILAVCSSFLAIPLLLTIV